MNKKMIGLQTAILCGGSLFAWYTVFNDFHRFLNAGGQWLKFSGCQYPNPLTTPCFYGAIVFLIAMGWSFSIMSMDVNKDKRNEKRLFWLLLAGVLFAWSNFGYELYRYYQPHSGPFKSCSGTLATHPIHTPCFYGAVVYLAAFLTAAIVLVMSKRKKYKF